MPVREFKGELDKPGRTVRMPDGTVIRNVPPGTTKAELMGRYQKLRANSGLDSGPVPKRFKPFSGKLDEEPDDMAETPFATRARFGNVMGFNPAKPPENIASYSKQDLAKTLPVVGGVVGSLAVPGIGWGALALQSLAAAGGATAGALGEQALTDQPIDPAQAFKRGAVEGVGNLIGGGVIKTLGQTAGKIFSSRPLPATGRQAAEFAGEQGAPFPLGFAQPSVAQRGASKMFGGKIANQGQAVKVAQFLNRSVGTITSNARPIDEAAILGQKFLREVFEPGEVAIRNAFAKYSAAVGHEAKVPTTHTLDAIKQASDLLEKRGQTTGGLYQRLRTILKKNPQDYTPREFDELYGAIIKQSFSSRGRAGGEGRLLLQGITRDLDDFGRINHRVHFGDDIAAAEKTREHYRELRNIPGLERLAKDFGKGGPAGTRNWMNELFADPNGKALAQFRTLNPKLYQELADSWLAGNIDRFSRPTQDGIGRFLDGKGFRSWFETSRKNLDAIYTPEQIKALDNFTVYAQYMNSAASKGGSGFHPADFMFSGPVSAASMLSGNLPLIVASESSAWVLARGVTDPKSNLFRLFTEGFSPSTRATMLRLGQLSGQAAANGSAKE